MTSCVAKGKKYVNEAIELATAQGFLCWKPGNKAHFIGKGRVVSQSQDIFEAFDFVATHKERMCFVQVKSDESDASKARALIDTIPMPEEIGRVVLMRVKGKPRCFKHWSYLGPHDWDYDGEFVGGI